jgi:hypothetical protein
MVFPLTVHRNDGGVVARRRPNPRFLLVGPYDPKGGEYTFLAPPLGVWRLAGVLAASSDSRRQE